MKKIVVFAILLASFAMAHAKEGGTVHSITLPAVATTLADGEGRLATETHCGSCHSLDYIVMQPELSKDAWTGTVNKMRKVFGAEISDADAGGIASYLAANYGSEKKNPGAAASAKDPDPGKAAKGSGEESFKKYCISCHAGGGNIINPKKTLHRKDREANGVKTAADIVKRMRHPGPGMPTFDEKSVPDAESNAIARYVIDTFQ
jgi:cytochrome c6